MEELKYFFSYSRKDSKFVLQLAKELRADGANVWLDQLDILGGEHWDDTIEKTLKSCKGVIAVLSPESVASSNVMDEVSYALDEGKLVVPVLIRPCEIPLRLRRLQYIDFTADYGTGFSQLLKALHIEQPAEPLKSVATQEPVVQDSTAPIEAKPTEPLAPEEQVAQEVEEPLSPKVSETIPDEVDHPKPTSLETEKVEEPLLPEVSEPTPDEQQPDVEVLSRAAYTITASAGAGGAINPSGETTINSEADQSFTITPETGYEIADVVVDGASVGAVASHTFTNVTADHTIDASFASKTYSLTATAVDGSVTKSPDQASYNHGETVTLEAVPSEGYGFKNWSGDLSGSNNPATLVMDADKVVTAGFALNVLDYREPKGLKTKKAESMSQKIKVLAAICIVALIVIVLIGILKPKTYIVTASAGDGGAINPSGTVTVNDGDDQAFTITPEPGYSVSDVAVDGASVGAVANYPFTNVTADHTITASFASDTYTLKVNAVDGSVTKSPDQASFKHGETVTLEAVPNEGYTFTGWSGDLSGSTNPAKLIMDAYKSVTAHFVLKTYNLDIPQTVGGSVTKSPDQTNYKHGETVTLEAVPNEGYTFTGWSGDLSGSTNPAKLVMDADKSVTAHFVLKTYNLDIPRKVGGSVTKSPDQTSFKHGETVTLEAVPNEGYTFTGWSGDLSGSTNPAKLVMDADKSVTAHFVLKTYNLDIPRKVGGSVTKSPDQTRYKHGETVTLEAVPNEGYTFTGWSGALSGSTNPAKLVMDRNKSVTANFERIPTPYPWCRISTGPQRSSVSEYMLPYLLLLGAWILIKRRDASRRNAINKCDKPGISDTQKKNLTILT